MSDQASYTDNVEFPSFDTSKTAEQFRAFAEKGAEQSKEAYSRLKSSAEWVQKTMETSVETGRAAASELSLKTIATMRANAETGFNHLEGLARARSVSEIIELQAAYVRSAVESVMNQTRDMQAAASKAAEDVSRPVKEGFESAMKELKVA